MRTEQDSLGEKSIPDGILYGIQTLRAVENFPISGERIPHELVIAYAHLKKSCARANELLGLLPERLAGPILSACDEIIAGEHANQFVVDIFQAGAGTSTNMNLNEVIANRALEILGQPKGRYDLVSPNDHVNMAQSTNDTYPTAMRLVLLMQFDALDQKLESLEKAFAKKSREFKTVLKSARTHLQDAVPITLGQEFVAYARSIAALRKNLKVARDSLSILGIGGSAAGTGLNVHLKFPKLVVQILQKNTGLKLKNAPDLVESMQSQRQILEFMNALAEAAMEISRIASDLRLLSCGPNTGFDEIRLPAVQPGSSIMPGKVNPSILECVNMVCFRVMGAQTTVTQCVHGGQLDLNVWMPLMAVEVLTSMKMLGNAAEIMAEKCIEGITANVDRCRDYANRTASLATILNPIIGYAKAAGVVKESIATGKPLTEILITKKILTPGQIKKVLDPRRMTR